ncbi:hypothetical protein QFC21_000651 [Naganishia friedmannii]|uniref:Uncharacterized protein n=1 Tax=Naganishia friedmannii TaxID=89922 RepID=A0ACC2WFK8_9TREE|nr:hypothetical protein QFC21_000651 [Naganishia friedmannii]
MSSETTMDDSRIAGYDPLIPPSLLRHDLPSSDLSRKTIESARQAAAKIVHGQDDRLLVIVGPCSIHDPKQALEYAHLLRDGVKSGRWAELGIVMRAYFEKPRTTVGWKGMINDPGLDSSFQINKGLRMARELLRDITELGMPVGCELLDTISPQFIADLISWGAIGARTTESQLHRELASGSGFPIGFKNGTDGSVGVAVDAMGSAEHPHCFMGINNQGMAAIVKTNGNKDVHVILRGGTGGPNYAKDHVQSALATMRKKRAHDPHASIMIDCSHGNSNKNHMNQPLVVTDICKQLEEGEMGITGVMFESNLKAGKQNSDGKTLEQLEYGVSITDACVDWETSVDMLDRLNASVTKRREAVRAQKQASA